MAEVGRSSHQDRFEDTEGKKEMSLLGDDGNLLGDVGSLHLLHRNKLEENLSLLGGQEAIEDLQKGGLPRSIRPDHSNELSPLRSERNILKHPIFMITEGDRIDLDHNVLITFLVIKRQM